MTDQSLPAWADNLKSQYLAGGSSFFILHGNVEDVVGAEENGSYATFGLADFLARQLFGRYELVLHYDLGRGLRALPGGDGVRLQEMNRRLERLNGGLAELSPEPGAVLRWLDRLVELLLVKGASGESPRTAFIFDYAQMICPPGERSGQYLATFLNWARSPVVKRVNMVFILLAPELGELHPALPQSAHIAEVRVPLPTLAERKAHVLRRFPDAAGQADRLAEISAGLTLSNLDSLLRQAQAVPAAAATADGPSAGDRLLAKTKKELIEAQCPGLLEFVEPQLDLTLVAGHTAAKKRLADDAKLIRAGRLAGAPMGYLICGPVGVGKTFIALCYAGTVGIPCVTIRNFRSKYVGETEANLERILGVLRELGPVAVIVDEADAAVGNRGASGDSGTSARVFASLAAQMGNTAYRGKIIWFLLTCRPDLLPVDLKRQGRCEEHIPLFYPQSPEELREMFLAMGRKMKLELTPEMLPEFSAGQALSGADIEAVLTRARRNAWLAEKPLDRELLAAALAGFRSSRGPEHELQWLAAICECTDLEYLPSEVRHTAATPEGFAAFQRRFQELQSRF